MRNNYPDAPLGSIRFASMRSLEAHTFDAQCHSISGRSDDNGDMYLRQVLGILNDVGVFIDTGYWDDTSSITCTAIVIYQRMGSVLGCVTFFSSAGLGWTRHVQMYWDWDRHTADARYGYATNTLDVASLQRKRFKLM